MYMLTTHVQGIASRTEHTIQTSKYGRGELLRQEAAAAVHMTVHMQSELIWPASMHDLEVRAWISRMQRLSARAQGAKSSDSNASMSAFGWLHQEGGAWQCGAVSRSALRQACARKERERERARHMYS